MLHTPKRRYLLITGMLVGVMLAFGGLTLAADSQTTRNIDGYHQAGSFTRSVLPPDLQALVGLTIPPRKVQVNVRDKTTGAISLREKLAPGKIPGLTNVGSGGLHGGLGLNEGFINSMPVLILDRQGPNQSRIIVDVVPLPPEIYWLRIVDGRIVQDLSKYSLTTVCKFKQLSKENSKYGDMIALRKPNKGKESCEHYTDQVRHAWGVVTESGRIEEIQPQSVVCLYESPNICR